MYDVYLNMLALVKTSFDADPVLEYCCSMQDLPFETISKTVANESNVVFAADEIFPTLGCPRNCSFCPAGGKGPHQTDLQYSFKILDFYKNLGATDLIPTDDQVLLYAVFNKDFAKTLIRVYEHAKKLGFTFFYGNGVETYALAHFINNAKETSDEDSVLYSKLLEIFVQTTSYLYLPYEKISGLSDQRERSRLPKLSLGKSGFELVLDYLNGFAGKENLKLVLTSFSLNWLTEKKFLIIMLLCGKITQKYGNLNIRYNGFFHM